MSNPNIALRFDEIYDSTSKMILAFITAKCRYTADIGDIYQDTYVELYQVLSKRGVDYITNDRALVLRIAKRKIYRYYSLLERLRIFVSINAVNEDNEDVGLSIPEIAQALSIGESNVKNKLYRTLKELRNLLK